MGTVASRTAGTAADPITVNRTHRAPLPSCKGSHTIDPKRNRITEPQGGLQIINLSEYVLTDMELKVLQKGLTFSPMQPLDKFLLTKDIYLFCRQLMFKILYHRPSMADQLPADEQQIFRDLLDLMREGEQQQAKILHP